MGPTSRIARPYTSELAAIRRCAAEIAGLNW
jgi:hypothetical protein